MIFIEMFFLLLLYISFKNYIHETQKCSKNRSGQCTWFPIPIFFFFSSCLVDLLFFSIIYPFDFDFCFYFLLAKSLFYFFLCFLLMYMESHSGRNTVLYTIKKNIIVIILYWNHVLAMYVILMYLWYRGGSKWT